MTLAIALTVNAVLIVSLLAALAYVISLPRKLAPHAVALVPAKPTRRRSSAPAPRARRTPVPVGS